MTHRRRQARNSRQQRIGFESLESRQVLTAAFADVDPDMWEWDAGAAAESPDILAESWVVADGWYDDGLWVDDSAWVDDARWNDEVSSSNDDWLVTADWSGDDSAVGSDVATAVVDAGVGGDNGLQAAIVVDADSTVTGEAAISEPNAFAPEAPPGPEAGPAAETFIVSGTPRDVAAESFNPAELAAEPVTDSSWRAAFEDLTPVTVATVTADTTAGGQHESVIDVQSSELILEGFDPTPTGLDDAAVAEVDEPVAVVDEPVAVVDEPGAEVDAPVAMVGPTTVPPRHSPARSGGMEGRRTSWFGMFMPGFSGFSAASDASSLSDSEIPGRGRLRGRLPFRPAN